VPDSKAGCAEAIVDTVEASADTTIGTIATRGHRQSLTLFDLPLDSESVRQSSSRRTGLAQKTGRIVASDIPPPFFRATRVAGRLRIELGAAADHLIRPVAAGSPKMA